MRVTCIVCNTVVAVVTVLLYAQFLTECTGLSGLRDRKGLRNELNQGISMQVWYVFF